MAVKKATTTALIKWDERFATAASEAVKTAAAVGGGGNFLSFKSGILSFQKLQENTEKKNNAIEVIILDYVLENQWYYQPFDEKNPMSPSCYAFGRAQRDMVPHEDVENPVNPQCHGCPNKEFGTADRGKGKACGDVMRLAMIRADEDIETAQIFYAKLPYFSTLEWVKYLKSLQDTSQRHPMCFVTELSATPDPQSQFRIHFKMESPIEEDNDVFEQIWNRHEEAMREIEFPYPKFDNSPEPAAPVRGRVAARSVPVERSAPAPVRPATRATAARIALPPSTAAVPAARGKREKF